MSIDRVDALEMSVLKMESTIESLAEKMGEVADSLNIMSNTVSKLALYEMKLDILKTDIQGVAESHRILEKAVEVYHTDDIEGCYNKLTGTKNDMDKISFKRFSMGMGVATFLFGYLWIQLHDEKLVNEKIGKDLTYIKVRVEKLKGEINVLNEKCVNIHKGGR